MASTPSVKIEKTMPFKGGSRIWSNRYHFNGGVPANDTQWHALMDAVVAAEKPIYWSGMSITAAIGYLAGSDVPVSSKTYAVAGTSTRSDQIMPGECVALLRWATPARSVKNHPIYLFNYFHGVERATATGYGDTVQTGQVSAIETYAGSWISGFSDGAHTLVRAGPNGVTASGHFVEEFITHRDFPYSRSA